jgi:hypothetical protein
MTIENLTIAMSICDEGELVFNLGLKRAFLLNNKWYPLRATIKCAKKDANEDSNLTTDRALVEFAYLIPYVRIADMNFTEQLPIINDNVITEIRFLSSILNNLIKQ